MWYAEHFRAACRYSIHDGMPVKFETLDPKLWNERGTVYARIAEGTSEPVYIGSTDKALRVRIKEHLALISKPRNQRYREWAEGRQITIIAYKPPTIELIGHVIPIHRAVEATLIAAFNPMFVFRKP